MASGDGKRIKKRLRAGAIELDGKDAMLLVHVKVEASELGPNDEVLRTETKDAVRRIALDHVTPETDVSAAAAEIVAAQKVIHESKQPLVEQALRSLQARIAGGGAAKRGGPAASQARGSPAVGSAPASSASASASAVASPASAGRERPMSALSMGVDRGSASPERPQSPAYLQNLDDYIEQLYENVDEKIAATGKILQLARSAPNLEHLVNNDTMLGALSRLLREEGRKSMKLVTNIVSVFFCFSAYSQFHPFITTNHVGDYAMRTIETEIKRHSLWMTELRKRQEAYEAAPKDERARTAFQSEVERKRRQLMRQEALLYVCFYVLMNLAEDLVVEKKMRRRKIVHFLVAMLDRRNPALLLLVCTFLKKLCIFKENKDDMLALDVVDKVAKFVPSENQALLTAALRLLSNLAFDKVARSKMFPLLPRLVALLDPRPEVRVGYRGALLQLLYHLASQRGFAPQLAQTDLPSRVCALILDDARETARRDIAGLAVNLSVQPELADALGDGEQLNRFLKRAIRYHDLPLMKLCHNLACHDRPWKSTYARHMDKLAALLHETTDAALLAETLGVLGAVVLDGFDYAALAKKHHLVQMLAQVLSGRSVDDDVALAAIIAVGTLAHDANLATNLAHFNLAMLVYQQLAEKYEDPETVLQSLFVLYKLLCYDDTRSQLLQDSDIVSMLIHLLAHSNEKIAQLADETLEVVIQVDPTLARSIRAMKFRSWNSEWLQLMSVDDDDDDHDDQRDGDDQDAQRFHGDGGNTGYGEYDDDGYGRGYDDEYDQEVRGIAGGGSRYYHKNLAVDSTSEGIASWEDSPRTALQKEQYFFRGDASHPRMQ